LDLSSILGIVLCAVVVVFGIVSGDEGAAALWNFFDEGSIFITIGGAFFCTMITTDSLKDFWGSIRSIRLILKPYSSDAEKTIRSIIDLSNIARKEGLLALEEAANDIDDEFLKKGVLLIVDGTDPELVRNILETELNCIEARHASKTSFWETMAAMGPAWGMIGTLIGLINMLKKLDDIASIGPNMALALVTTFYGSVLANWICLPIANKLKANNAKEIMIKEIMVEGLLSIQAGENPRVIEEKLKSFLSPDNRNAFKKDEGESVG